MPLCTTDFPPGMLIGVLADGLITLFVELFQILFMDVGHGDIF